MRQTLALPAGDAVGGVGCGRIVRPALGEVDAAAREKRVDSFDPRPAVDVRAVVAGAIDGNNAPTPPLGEAKQQLVERVCPRLGVQDAAVREDAVQVEQARVDVSRKTEHLPADGKGREPRRRMNTFQFGDAREQAGCLQPLLHEVTVARGDVQADRPGAGGVQRTIVGVERALPLESDLVEIGRAFVRRPRRRRRHAQTVPVARRPHIGETRGNAVAAYGVRRRSVAAPSASASNVAPITTAMSIANDCPSGFGWVARLRASNA